MNSAVGGDEPLDHRRDPLAPLAPVEDAVMADVFGHEIFLAPFSETGRDVERGTGLAQPGNIIALALDRQ
jgi:hypothetical protein